MAAPSAKPSAKPLHVAAEAVIQDKIWNNTGSGKKDEAGGEKKWDGGEKKWNSGSGGDKKWNSGNGNKKIERKAQCLAHSVPTKV